MGIKIKHTNPTLNEFSNDDLVVNVQEGSLFFKSNTELFRIKGDTLNTTVTESFGDELWNRTGNNLYYTSGSVGIGTNNPTTKLEVKDSTVPQFTIKYSDTHYMTLSNQGYFVLADGGSTANQFVFTRGSTEQMRIDENGNVGIGTHAPTGSLHIKNSVLNVSQSIENQYRRYTVGVAGYDFRVRDETDDEVWINIDGNNDWMSFAQSGEGNVGVGITVPSAPLHVHQGGTDDGTAVEILRLSRLTSTDLGTATPVGEAYIGLHSDDSGTGQLEVARISWAHDNAANGEDDGRLDFFTRKDDTLTRAVTINHDGLVGMGTDAPSYKLHVRNDSAAQIAHFRSDNSGTNFIKVERGSNTTTSLTAGASSYGGGLETSRGLRLSTEGNSITSPSMVITGSNVGIGTSSPTSLLHVLASGDSLGSVDLIHLSMQSTTSEGDIGIKFSDHADVSNQHFRIIFGEGSNDLRFKSDTDDNILYLENDGNVGINTNDPEQKLHVYNGSILVEPILYANSQNAYILKYGAYNNATWDSWGLKFKSTSGGTPYTSWRTYTTDDIITWTAGGAVSIGGGAYWGDSGETLYAQRDVEAATTGFTTVASFKNPTNAASNQGATAGIKLKLGSTSEHHKWAGIACQSAASYSNTTELTFWPNDTTGGEKAVLTSGGNWDIAGAVNAGSDIRWKENINTIETPLETIKQLRGVTFDWKDKKKDNEKMQHGCIAQEVEKILPNLITERKNYKHLNYTGIIPILIEAMKEQQIQIDELKKQING
tara:strand:+ start:486 stop:2789 length:2304 start_codon:yes stop_codon:yes gene_type:complete